MKANWAWWYVPGIPALKVEAGGLGIKASLGSIVLQGWSSMSPFPPGGQSTHRHCRRPSLRVGSMSFHVCFTCLPFGRKDSVVMVLSAEALKLQTGRILALALGQPTAGPAGLQ